MRIASLLGAAAMLACAPVSASAQTQAEFIAAFAADWQAFDDRFAEAAAPCTLALGEEEAGERFRLTASGCRGELADVTAWSIVDSQMVLYAGDKALASLGGNQRRMSGVSESGIPIILDRSGPNGDIEALQTALQESGCYYLGFTDECAGESLVGKPEIEDGTANVQVLVNLNVRAEARDNAASIGVIPRNSCISTSACVTARDGTWCSAVFDGRTGWMRQLALRLGRWPVITFAGSCSQ